MRMLWLLPIFLVSTLLSCSCHPSTTDGESLTASQPPPNSTDVPPSDLNAPSAQAASEFDLDTYQAMAAAADHVHHYLNTLALLRTDDADRCWAKGALQYPPQDASLRALLTQAKTVRINNSPPLPLDQHSPPRIVEVPVQLRIQTPDGLQRVHGTYQAQFKPEAVEPDSSWEIITATLQPALQ